MERNLLLGNGINAHLGVTGMVVAEIAERFTNALIQYNDFFDLMFGVRFTKELCHALFARVNDLGIESLASVIYEYIKRKIMCTKSISDNDIMRLLDSIICCAITAIFYEGSIKLGRIYLKDRLPDISHFTNIYTLNYAEFWDATGRCIHLHGKYDLNLVKENGKRVLHYSAERSEGYEGYNEIVEQLKSIYNMCKLETRNIVFSPASQKKSDIVVVGCYPSEALFPSNDLFPHIPTPLYEELSDVRSIEVFGVSPYGDNDIVKRLNTMEKVTIYVYNSKINEESKVWDSLLTCPHAIKDSMDIMR